MFPAGYKSPGRPKGSTKSLTIRELLKAAPIAKKRALVLKAYELALEGDVRFMEFIAKHSGEGASFIEDVAQAGGSFAFTLRLDSPMETENS